MAGVTNQLVEYCNAVSSLSTNDAFANYDHVVASGEQITSGLLALQLQTLGRKARAWAGWQLPLTSDTMYSKARIDEIGTSNILASLAEGHVAVVAGFQGVSPDNRITTLGRGGSDTSAVALAAALKAERCDIYTDVDGVFTTDPRVVPEARKMSTISFDELLEMTATGCPKPAMRSVEVAHNHAVPLHVRSAFTWEPGTYVGEKDLLVEAPIIRAVTHDTSESKITVVGVPDRPGVAATLFRALADADVNVDMIVQNVSADGTTDMTFTVGKADLPRAHAALGGVQPQIGYETLLEDPNVAKISVVGVGMRSHAGVAKTMFQALSSKGINIQVISTSEIKISVLIDASYTELAVRTLHTLYGLDQA